MNVENQFLNTKSPFKFVFSAVDSQKLVCIQKAGVKCPY